MVLVDPHVINELNPVGRTQHRFGKEAIDGTQDLFIEPKNFSGPLRELDCDLVQGFVFSPPVASDKAPLVAAIIEREALVRGAGLSASQRPAHGSRPGEDPEGETASREAALSLRACARV